MMNSGIARTVFGAAVSVLALALVAIAGAEPAETAGWAYYGGDPGGSRYSPLAQIGKGNVNRLELVWQYRTGAVAANPSLRSFIDFQATPILLPPEAGQSLVVCDPFGKVIALDPEHGTERWTMDPKIDKTPYAGRFKCKGVAYWHDTRTAPLGAVPEAGSAAGGTCEQRLFLATADKRLIAMDARDGTLCKEFGDHGAVDVDALIRGIAPAEGTQGTQLVSPPAIVRDIVVVSSTSNKFKSAASVNGAVRGFDARTGALRWSFDPLARESAPGVDATPPGVGGGNVWAPMSVDNQRDLVFLPTASAAPNYWGAHRPGNNKWANSIVALRGSTGELVWGFQTLHHDVWDRDVGSPPIAVDMQRDGQIVPALFQLVKTGMLFAFNRETGEPLFPIEERPVPIDTDIAGERLSPTQPFPTRPPVLVRNTISADDAWGFTPYDRGVCRKKIEALRHGTQYEPISTQGTLLYPQPGGGANWGGGAFDPVRNLLVTPVSQIPYYVRLLPKDKVDPEFSKRPEAGAPMQKPGLIGGTPYGVEQGPLMSPFFSPCTAPPWELLVAVDMAKGEIRWRVPLGVLDKLMPVPVPLKWGTPAAGGPIITGSGLIFIGATADARIRAFDVESGAVVWHRKVPTAAQATPMTYMVNGRQYVVFAAGGHSWFYAKGIDDYLLAFALPK